MVEDLIQWISEQLDEDERIARATDDTLGQRQLQWSVKPVDDAFRRVIAAGHYDVGTGEFNPQDAEHIARHDPCRVLREIDAKRQILRALESAEVALRNTEPGTEPRELMTGAANSLRAVVRMLAVAYADQPGYREEWRP